MKCQLLVLAAVLSLAAADAVSDKITADTQGYKYNSAVMRAFIGGYYTGMYKSTTYKVNDQCLGDKTIADLVTLDTAYSTNSFNLTNVAGPAQELIYLFIKYCEFDDALFDLAKWCSKNDCSVNTMFQTLLKKIFQVTTVANDLATLLTEPKPAPTDFAAVQTYFTPLGVSIGKLLRYATAFDPNQLKSSNPMQLL